MLFLNLLLDITMIGLVATGIFYAVRLTRQLADMRAHRQDMERFIQDFAATVLRAENGIKGLKAAARSSGDDLEKLIERAHSLRDELHFLVESADQTAGRLSAAASDLKRPAETPAATPTKQTAKIAPLDLDEGNPAPASSAERELLRALRQMG